MNHEEAHCAGLTYVDFRLISVLFLCPDTFIKFMHVFHVKKIKHIVTSMCLSVKPKMHVQKGIKKHRIKDT